MFSLGDLRVFTHNSDMNFNNLKVMPGEYRITVIGCNNYQKHSKVFTFLEPTTLFFYVGSPTFNNQETDVRTFDGDWNSFVSRESRIITSVGHTTSVLSSEGFAQIVCLSISDPYIVPTKQDYELCHYRHEHMAVDAYFNN